MLGFGLGVVVMEEGCEVGLVFFFFFFLWGIARICVFMPFDAIVGFLGIWRSILVNRPSSSPTSPTVYIAVAKNGVLHFHIVS